MYPNVIPWRLSVTLLLAMTSCFLLMGGQLSLSNIIHMSGDEIQQLYDYSQGTYNRNMLEVEDPTTVKIKSFTLEDPPPLNLRKDPVLRYRAKDGQTLEVPDHVARVLDRRRIERASQQTTMQKAIAKAESAKLSNEQDTGEKQSWGNGEMQLQQETTSTSGSFLVGDRNLAIQPLLPWEKTAIETRTCQTPHRGIPNHCCPGSFSAGGRLLFAEDVCNGTEQYEQLQEYSLEYLKKPHLAIDDQDQCDACALVEMLMNRNLTLSFVGDSLTRQSIAGLECELLRRGYFVRSKKIPITKRQGCSWRDCLGEWVEFTVIDPMNTNQEMTATINHFGMYRPDPNNLDLKEVILPHSDIVIFDHGLHWKPTEQVKFGEAMRKYLEGFRNSNLTMLAWRETSAQHMDAEGGHYGIAAKSKNCVPIHPEYQAGFRMPIMQEAAERAGFQWRSLVEPDFSTKPEDKNELVFLPFRDYTVPLHYLHPNKCTHYCHTPYLWLPLWRSLRIALDRAVKTNR